MIKDHPRSLLPAIFSSIAALLATSAPTPLPAAESERPNILLIMVDDMGFSDLGFMGSEIDTPNLDALARGGVRFSQFHNTGRCCPTRASLLTGLHPHQTGIGWMTQPPGSDRGADKPPAYQGYLNRQCATISEVLGQNGYATLMAGKWHLGYNAKDRWPLQRGFDKFYGAISGATRFFHPHADRGITFMNEKLAAPESTTDEAFYTTDAFTDYGIRFLREHGESERKDDPFFLYLAYTAPHWPLQAFEDDIAKYRGKYRDGWDALRKKRHQRQVELGLADESWDLSPRTPGIPDWDSLDEKQREELDLKMAVYAAMIDRIDQNIGRLTAFLKDSGLYDDTLILFLSDNGACQEGGMLGRGEFFDREKRNLEDDNSYGEAWANASNTPFRLYKHFAHEGGTATPFFLHWPAKIDPREDWYAEPAQLIDIVPTLLDVAGAEYPERAHGNEIPPLDGVSLRPAFDGKALGRGQPIFLEHETNAAVRDGKWKLVGTRVATNDGTDAKQWELYDMAEDRTETRDLAKKHPKKAEELAAKWEDWAERVQVYPRGGAGTRTPKPGAYSANQKKPSGKKKKTGNADLQPETVAPQVAGRAFSVIAMARHPEQPKGVLLAQGGNRFGWSLHFVDGRPAFSVRNRGDLTEIIAEDPVTKRTDLVAELTAERMRLWVGGRVAAETESPGLLAEQPVAGFFVGFDGAQAVGDYRAPNRFNGRVNRHRITFPDEKVAMRTEWGEKVTADNAWREYPRPQMRRENWTNLNGHWDYAITPGDRAEPPTDWEGKILVPYAIEAPLSGVERRITADDALWYRRSFSAPKRENKRTLLNFEAVDYHSTVWVNGEKVGEHKGGNLPFSFDITEALRDGGENGQENELLVRVTDSTDHPDAYQLHGKQLQHAFGIYYTPVSGIWQTVWMEEVPEQHLREFKITSSITPNGFGEVVLDFERNSETNARRVGATISLDGKFIASAGGPPISPITFTIPDPQLWSPDSPTLYDLEIEFGEDKVHSYVGLRETGIAEDADGHARFTLNGEPLFHWGTLDQGWWPDGLLTPPSDEAMLSDIEYLKAAGFNTIRKHVKVEPRRYYYHCDRLGVLVWQDQVNAGTGTRRGEGLDSPTWSRLKPGPTDADWPDEAHAQFMAELKTMIDTLGNHPSIVQWVPFNEAWGQHRTAEVTEWTAEYDPTRAINAASGGNWFPVGDIVDAHAYPHPKFPWDNGEGGRFDGFVKVMGEFGGHGFPVEGHLWDPASGNWGYGGLPENKEEWLERYRTSIEILADLKKKGIAAGIYTQTTDVEGEINGLLTYDRKVRKIEPEVLEEIAELLVE